LVLAVCKAEALAARKQAIESVDVEQLFLVRRIHYS
jgi:hypothetical protein